MSGFREHNSGFIPGSLSQLNSMIFDYFSTVYRKHFFSTELKLSKFNYIFFHLNWYRVRNVALNLIKV